MKELELSKTDPGIRKMLEGLYLDEDRKASFHRFCVSQEFKTMLDEIIRHAGCDWNVRICEIGAGHGFLAMALAKEGFHQVSILEPSQEWMTGTGFIVDMAKTYGVRIWNDLESWYESDELYDIIITKACVHHFDNACKVAAEIKCKINDNGKWLMFDESFANSPKELYSSLTSHPHVYKYGQYEWPYSAKLYVEFMRLAGYRLEEVIPFRYKNNHIARNVSDEVKFSKPVTMMSRVLVRLKLTVSAFAIEALIDHCVGIGTKMRLFTKPQLLVFRAQKIDYPVCSRNNV